ncbi:filamentous hemagglutinin N-terminal domain-containing protein [Acaryochloris marina]|uniref:two-partner secretion domain-containing protein n=1 Tax=Acaryochloris marina TaxID=155978 RepID=UPI001BAFDA59|nr:filamentous hemagglutinin N-terminal domain-containing protein [Acaryochloris marina]QUY44231.1 filamentous hemagglutinin N-terminal domain-containing protein [Acaryochloris marina S15]
MKNFIPALAIALNLTLFLAEASFFSVRCQSIQADGTTPTKIDLPAFGKCQGTCTISGGKRQGNNLFHSFEEFNVDLDSTVLFVNPNAQNIISRVTGNNPSNILGTLGVQSGEANLFLVNPNGILFGEKASLGLNGSFIATTANAIQFGNQGILSVSKSDIPRISINPSALFFQEASGAIVNSSREGLSVPTSHSLHLIGGDVILDNGRINSFGGRVELGGLATSGIVTILPDKEGFSLKFPDSNLKSNVLLTNARIDVTGEGGGNLSINAGEIEIERSRLLAGIGIDLGSSFTQAGNITLKADESITIHSESNINNRPLFNAKGLGGDVVINSKSLYVTTNSQVGSNTFGIASAGNVILKVQEEILLDSGSIFNSVATFQDFRATGNGGKIIVETDKLYLKNEAEFAANVNGTGDSGGITINASDIILSNFSGILSSVETGGIGQGGEIRIFTDTLTLQSGSQIASSVLRAVGGTPGGIGEGGDIHIEASESINISGFDETNGFPSGILAATEEGAIGPAGNIIIKTDTFSIVDGALLNTDTFNKSDGGSITIFSNNLEVINGGRISTATFNQGNAGFIKLNVTGEIKLAGSDANFDRRLKLIETFLVEAGSDKNLVIDRINSLRDIGPNSGLYASATSGASGKAGNISIDPRLVLIQDGANITVNNAGSGPGGDIFLQSIDLTLDNGTISATSNSNSGGNISLLIDNILLLRNNSQISTTAAGDGTGGNIDIKASLIVAYPFENNDITANALNGKGGKITITTKGIYGLEERNQLTDLSDITAFSQNTQLNGVVEITNPEVDPSENLSEQPEVVEPPKEIAKGCRPGQSLGGSTFTHVGRGGLPISPHHTQTPTTVWQDLRSHNLQPTSISTTDTSPSSLIPSPPPNITEAKGWTKDTQGRIYLTADVPQPAQSLQPIATC